MASKTYRYPLPKNIEDRYKVKITAKTYILKCKLCDQKYELFHSHVPSTGAVLALLNHSLSHVVPNEDDE